MRYLKYWVPPLIYMGLIFIISSLEQPPLPMPKFEWLTIDKLYHFIEYGILGALLAIAFVNVPCRGGAPGPPRLGGRIRDREARGPRPTASWRWAGAVLIAILYGASDEWHQTFVPGRLATLADWVADVVGAITGVLGVYLYYRKK